MPGQSSHPVGFDPASRRATRAAGRPSVTGAPSLDPHGPPAPAQPSRLLLGGFTTYSSFNHETVRFIEERAYALAAGYVAAMVVVCFAAGLLGLAASRWVTGAAGGLLGGWR